LGGCFFRLGGASLGGILVPTRGGEKVRRELDKVGQAVFYSLYKRKRVDGRMYSRQAKVSSSGVLQLRREAGRWLKELREGRGLSQRNLADLVGAEYYTFISQLETGRGRIPPDRYGLWAEALGVDARVFVRTLMRYYDPVTHAILFGGDEALERGGRGPG
jgi:hypothetical protein